MSVVRRFLFLITAFAVTAFSLPALAHYVTLEMAAGASGQLTAKITNKTSSGNYTINSIKLPFGTNVGSVASAAVTAYTGTGSTSGVTVSGGYVLVPNVNLSYNKSITLTLSGVTPSSPTCAVTSTKWNVQAYENANYSGFLYLLNSSGNTLTVNLTPACYTIAASAGAGGIVAPPGNTQVASGGSKTYTITPNANYHVAGVLVDGVSAGAVTSYTFSNVTSNHTIAATFAINTNVITASAGANGGISPSGAVSVNYGANQSFTITPSANYHVADVLVDGSSVGAMTSYTFTNVTAGHAIAASFAINTAGITASAGANGAISPTGVVNVPYGSGQTFTITPNVHYHIADVMVDGSSVGPVASYTFTNVTVAHTITAGFAIDTNAITASAGAHGSIAPSGVVNVPYGTDQAFTIAADPGYYILDVLVDGGSVTGVSSYPFTNVTAAHTIAASFALKTLTFAPSPQSATSASVAPIATTAGPTFSMKVGLVPSPTDGTQVTLTATVPVGAPDGTTCPVLGPMVGSQTAGTVSGSATFANLTFTGTAGTCTLTATATGYPPAVLTPFVVFAAGDLDCTNGTGSYSTSAGTGTGPFNGPLDPAADQAYVGDPLSWGLRRYNNLDGSCTALVNYTLTTGFDPGNGKPATNLVYDKGSPPQAGNFKYVIVWPAQPITPWPELRPEVSWISVGGVQQWIPGLACLSDNPLDGPALVMPTIPDIPPYSGNPVPEYQPFDAMSQPQRARMCIAQVGWTPLGGGLVQFWTKVIDQSDGGVRQP
jgi:hypothetical protein